MDTGDIMYDEALHASGGAARARTQHRRGLLMLINNGHGFDMYASQRNLFEMIKYAKQAYSGTCQSSLVASVFQPTTTHPSAC